MDGCYLCDASCSGVADPSWQSQSTGGANSGVTIVASKRNLLFPKMIKTVEIGSGLVVEEKLAYKRFLRKRFLNCGADSATELWPLQGQAASPSTSSDLKVAD